MQHPTGKKVRHHPRISAAKLGEYMTRASASRREKIVHDQKFPSDYIVARYKAAADAIKLTLIAGGDLEAKLLTRSDALATRPAATENQIKWNKLCSEALRRFAKDILPQLPEGVRPVQMMFRNDPIEIAGVDVSVHCSVGLELVNRGKTSYGALLLVFRKELVLGAEAGEAVAELVRQHAERTLMHGGSSVHRKLCIVADVFGGEVYFAPTARQRVSRNLEAACREIGILWAMAS